MKNVKLTLGLILLLFLVGFAPAKYFFFSDNFTFLKDSVEKKVYFKINGLPFNKQIASDLKKFLVKEPGLLQCSINFETATAHITFDSRKTDSYKLSQAIERFNAEGDYPRYHAVEWKSTLNL